MNHSDFKTDRQWLLEAKSEKIKELRDESNMRNVDNILKVRKNL
jgi:hypothetical protein